MILNMDRRCCSNRRITGGESGEGKRVGGGGGGGGGEENDLDTNPDSECGRQGGRGRRVFLHSFCLLSAAAFLVAVVA